ncbi:DUF924 family protein [Iodidimonas sp. SYSU 1G8]|uniref:DUF924 family protein n=1 Tax=Iodidimonas sp. SYSU 1G8 TaxID=3133967 RepID=UPI0031FEF068
MTTVNAVIDFWFPENVRPSPDHPEGLDNPAWFTPDAAYDSEIARRFGEAWGQAGEGALDGWTATPEGALALTILLDQFPRNMFRGDPRAFSTDPKALAVALAAIDRGDDADLPAVMRKFFYLPLEHAEDPAMQARCVALFTALGEAEALRYAVLHRDIIARFGRFPHRNHILGRVSTPEETAWLEGGGETFGTSV